MQVSSIDHNSGYQINKGIDPVLVPSRVLCDYTFFIVFTDSAVSGVRTGRLG